MNNDTPTLDKINAISSKYFANIKKPIPQNTDDLLPQNIYVYYYHDDPRNPYSTRPYQKKHVDDCTLRVFERHPERFERLYGDDDTVEIWKVLVK